MCQASVPILTLETHKQHTWPVTEVLLVTALCIFSTWYAHFHWKRRYLYKMANKVQGPKSYPVVGSALQFLGTPSHIFKKLKKLFDDFPDGMKIWFGHLLYYGIKDPESLKILLNHPKALHKDGLYRYAKIFAGDGLFAAPVSIWKRHRKAILPTFNQKILDSFVPIFGKQSKILVEQLKKVSGKGEIDLFRYITNCTADIFCETAMGAEGTAQTSDSTVVKYIDKVLEVVFLRMFYILYHFDFIFKLTKLHKQEQEAVNFLHSFTNKFIKEKRKAYKKRLQELKFNPEAQVDDSKKWKAFLDFLIEGDVQFTDQELSDEVHTFLVAGTDTTAVTNCFILMTLGMHQDVQQRVYEEVMDVVGPDKMIDANDIPKLKYLERVIKETLRLFPVGPIIVRAVEDDIELPNFVIPGGASCIIGIQSLHKDSRYWPDPLKFDPDRFLPEEVAKRHPYAYVPFSAGPRNCIGIKYGMMAMASVIATVVRNFKIDSGYKSIEEVALKAYVILRPCAGFKQRIYEEVIDVIGPDRMIDADDIPKLKYLKRVLKENLRLFPIAPIIARAINDDMQLSNFTIPRGASVVVGILSMHRDSRYWPNPLKFDPDRFLPEEVAKRPTYAYIPFAAGPRNCIGLQYAMMAMTTVIATVVRKFIIHSDYKSIEEVDLKAHLALKPSAGFKVSFELR